MIKLNYNSHWFPPSSISLDMDDDKVIYSTLLNICCMYGNSCVFSSTVFPYGFYHRNRAVYRVCWFYPFVFMHAGNVHNRALSLLLSLALWSQTTFMYLIQLILHILPAQHFSPNSTVCTRNHSSSLHSSATALHDHLTSSQSEQSGWWSSFPFSCSRRIQRDTTYL